jgi:mono/diheme cytochrome c family protein
MIAFHRIIVSSIAALAIGACTTPPSVDPADPPDATSFAAGLVARGARLAAIGNCATCHTAPGGRSYAGGRALATPFGTMYGTNITPEPETGIGRWSRTAFARAMRDGIDREGRHLYPAFPYEYFTRMTDGDLDALYAFLMTRDPVRAVTPSHELAFPFNVRSLVGAWKFLHFDKGDLRPDPSRSARWHRGAYLVDAVGHCGACHTPRNRLGGEIRGRYLAGGEAEHWHAPALDATSPAPVPWDAERLFAYLRTGLGEFHAIAAGPMAPVVHNLRAASDEDVRAIAGYVAATMGDPGPDRLQQAERALWHARRDEAAGVRIDRSDRVDRIDRESAGTRGRSSPNGAEIYAGACSFCHDIGRRATSGSGLHLALGTALTVPTPVNLIHIVLDGVVPPDGEPGRWMPGYAEALSDEQVTDLVDYLRAEFGRAPPWPGVKAEVRRARALGAR